MENLFKNINFHTRILLLQENILLLRKLLLYVGFRNVTRGSMLLHPLCHFKQINDLRQPCRMEIF